MITDSKKEYAWGKKTDAYNGAQTVLKTKKRKEIRICRFRIGCWHLINKTLVAIQ